jgi:hypothetical protein
VTTTHDEWVEAGYCPAVGENGEWCVREAGHGTVHETPQLHDGHVLMVQWVTA